MLKDALLTLRELLQSARDLHDHDTGGNSRNLPLAMARDLVEEMLIEVDQSTLHVVMHNHKWGVTTYLVKSAEAPELEEVIEATGMDYEPEKQEYLEMDRYNCISAILDLDEWRMERS